MSSDLTNSFRVGDFTVDQSLNSISYGDDVRIVEPKVMEVLYYMAARPGQVISRYELMDALWQVNVSDGAVSRVIGLLRKCLNDNSETPAYIQTIAKKGYRLIAPVSPLPDKTIRPQNSHEHTPNKTLLSVSAGIALLIAITASWFYLQPVSKQSLIVSKPRFVQLTSDPGFEYDATLSTDENWLLYRHRRTVLTPYNLYLKARDTQHVQQLTDTAHNESSPAFSHDQSRIAFFSKSPGHCRLKMLSLDKMGSPAGETTLYKCGAFNHYSNVVWAADGEKVYFTDRSFENVPYQIYELQIATGRTRAITQSIDNYYGDNELSLSPSGQQLAFFRNKYWGNNEVYILDLKTQNERKIKELGFLAWNISWTKDEKFLLFSDNRFGGELNQINVETGEISGLYYAPQSIGSPELSNSGRSIIYSTEFADVDLWEIPFSQLGTTAVPQKMKASSSRIDMQPVLSRDGRKMLFLSDRNGGMQLWLQDAEQLKVMTSLPAGVRIDQYIWHPTEPLVVVAMSDKTLHLLNTTLDTSQQIDIDATGAYPHFSLDGNTLYYTSDITGDWQIWALNMTTMQQEQLTTTGGYRAQKSPKGDRLYFSKFRREGIWELDLMTGKETLKMAAGDRNSPFTVCSDALVYQQRAGTISLIRYDLATGKQKSLMTAPRNAKIQFHVIGDCDSIAFSKWDNVQSDIIELILTD